VDSSGSGKGESSLEPGSEISGAIQGEMRGAVTGVYLQLVIWLVSSLGSCCLGLVEAPPYTECPRRNVPDFGRVFLMLKYTDITQNTYVQS